MVFEPEIAKVAHAFGSPLRVRILELLAQGESPVERVRGRLKVPLTTLSSQLQVLQQAGLLESRRRGRTIHYRIADERVIQALMTLRDLAEARSLRARGFVNDFLGDTSDIEHVDGDRLWSLLRSGEAVAVDVRPREEFEAGHIPGAISVPVAETEGLVESLPSGARIVAYCRDAYCLLAPDAVRALKKLGLESERLDIGFTEWVAEGRPVDAGLTLP